MDCYFSFYKCFVVGWKSEYGKYIWLIEKKYEKKVKARLVDGKSNYIRIGICIIRNTICSNVILIIIHLFGNNIIIEP